MVFGVVWDKGRHAKSLKLQKISSTNIIMNIPRHQGGCKKLGIKKMKMLKMNVKKWIKEECLEY